MPAAISCTCSTCLEEGAAAAGAPAPEEPSCGAKGEALTASTRQFGVEVDAQHRALHLRYFSLQKPHARSFHAAYLAFFSATFAVFAVPSLVSPLRDDLGLTDQNLTDGVIASVAGTVAARLVMGTVCELLGPRLGSASVLLCCSGATFGMALVSSAGSYIAVRGLMGIAMAIFVHCQFWTSVMYAPRVVGLANGLAAGLANSGAGWSHLFCIAMLAAVGTAEPQGMAWRITLLLPGALQVGIALGVLAFSQDCPEGDYRALRASGALQQPPLAAALREAAANLSVWALALAYSMTFGVELTINNFIQQYFTDTFQLGNTTAGVLASLFGLCNIAARPAGGLLSDAAAARCGLQGRAQVVFLLTALAGGACMALKAAAGSLAGTVCALVAAAAAGMGSSGAVWGVVPFLGSKDALGATAGIVGAAGPIGSLLLSSLVMKTQQSKSDGFFYIGLVELCVSPIALVLLLPWGQRRQRRAAQQAEEEQAHQTECKEEGGGEGGCSCGPGGKAQGGEPATPRRRRW